MKMKISFDIHGVLNEQGKFFAELTNLLVKNGHEVHIITGGRDSKELRGEIEEHGIVYTHFFSITSHHESIGTEVIYDEIGNPIIENEVWDRTKGAYCALYNINMHFDDSEAYFEYFHTPVNRYYSKNKHPKSPRMAYGLPPGWKKEDVPVGVAISGHNIKPGTILGKPGTILGKTGEDQLAMIDTELHKTRWIRFSEQKPPVNEPILVLVEGEVHEGFLDSYVLIGRTEPTEFKTLFTNRRGSEKAFSAQHTSWGYDPYWMPMPAPKPEQLTRERPKYDVLEKEEAPCGYDE